LAVVGGGAVRQVAWRHGTAGVHGVDHGDHWLIPRAGTVMMVAFLIGEVVTAVPAGRLLDRLDPGRGTRVLLGASALAAFLIALASADAFARLGACRPSARRDNAR